MQELVNDNFTIYSRSTKFDSSPFRLKFLLSKITENPKGFEVSPNSNPHLHLYRFQSNARGFNKNYSLQQTSEVLVYQDKVKWEAPMLYNNLTKSVFQASMLLRFTVEFLRNLTKQVELLNISELSYRIANDEHEMLKTSELGALLNQLRSCDSTAVLLPTHLGYQYKKNLEKEGHSIVYQGEETFYDKSVAISMNGLVLPYMVQRASYAERCGLWKRWQNLHKARFMYKRMQKVQTLQTPNMGGNIVIIFTIWTSGLL